MIGGANVATILIMLFVGYSDLLNPAKFPILCNIGLAFPLFLIINLGFLIFWLIFRPKGAIIPLLGFIIGYAPVRKYIPFNIPRKVPEGAIKVLSYNTFGFSGYQGAKGVITSMTDYLKRQDADIVCFQEYATQTNIRDSVNAILDSIYPYRDITPYNTNCLAIFSKYPILSKERIAYQSVGNMSIAYKVSVNGETILVVNNHLETTGLTIKEKSEFKNLVSGDLESNMAKEASKSIMRRLSHATQIRAQQAEAVARYISYHRGTPMIVCGDFNDSPISYAHRTIAKGLTDCYVSSGNGVGVSYHDNRFYVRIDNILCTDDFTPYGCKVDSKIKGSDHYPIICWLKKNS